MTSRNSSRRADDAFHRAFADGIDVGNIWAVLEREKAQFDRLRFLSLPNVTPVSTLISQHKAILVAVCRGDVAAAERAAREHLSEVLKVSDTLVATHPELIVDDLRTVVMLNRLGENRDKAVCSDTLSMSGLEGGIYE